MADLETAPPAVKLFAEYLMYGPGACAASESMPTSPNASSAALSEEATATPATPAAPGTPGAGDDSSVGLKGKMGGLMGRISASAKNVSASAMNVSPFGDKKNAGTRDWVGRTKLTLQCENIRELKLPKFLMHYNGKPVLLRESGNLVRGDDYVELDINVKKFGALCNKMLPLVLARQCFMVVSIGFIVESREEAEMPEGVYGTLRSHKASGDPRKVPLLFQKTENKTE
jgi:hypothetical protein